MSKMSGADLPLLHYNLLSVWPCCNFFNLQKAFCLLFDYVFAIGVAKQCTPFVLVLFHLISAVGSSFLGFVCHPTVNIFSYATEAKIL